MVFINRQSGKIELRKVTAGSIGGALASASVTINDNTPYGLTFTRKQKQIVARLGTATFTYNSSSDFGTGQSGLYSNTTNVKFDNFGVQDGTARPSLTPGIVGVADASIVSGELLVQGSTQGGEAIIDTFRDDDYLVQVDVKLNSGTDADIWVRRTDADNAYVINLDGTTATLFNVQNGKYTSVASSAYTTAASVAVTISLSGSTIKAWVDGTLEINTTDSTHSAGGVALGGDQPKFDNLKIGYDNNTDDDIDDAEDDLVVDEDFGSTDVTVSHDDAGNLIDDGKYGYTYDAWHRLVKVRASADSKAVTIQTAEFDARGRRIQKVVTNSGDLDATTVYLYNGSQIIETRDGSSSVVAQFIHGKRYIDELVMTRVTGKGDFYYHQDANWNVIALTDLGGSVLERYNYTAYGEMTVHQETSFGDRDGDQDVDATDKGTVGVDCTGTVSGACRILDLDFDGDYDATDATAFDALAQGLSRHPGRTLTGVDQPFAHQGLLYEPEIGSYQNRARQYDPATRRFMQRDPLAFVDAINNLTVGAGGIHRLTALHYADGMNLVAYQQSNPLNHHDPSGLATYNCRCNCSRTFLGIPVWTSRWRTSYSSGITCPTASTLCCSLACNIGCPTCGPKSSAGFATTFTSCMFFWCV